MIFQDVRVYTKVPQQVDTSQPASMLAWPKMRPLYTYFYYYLYIYIRVCIRGCIYFSSSLFSLKPFALFEKVCIAGHILLYANNHAGY